MISTDTRIPCVVFAYNRPDKLEQVLTALNLQPIERLIVFVDGPKDDEDTEAVEQCRGIAEEVDWVDKELCFSEKNRGLVSLQENIDAVLSEYPAAIFLEDDCLPMPAFCEFVGKALRHYEKKQRVFSIGGYQPLHPDHFQGYAPSLVSYWRFSCWGWATWQDRWSKVKPLLPTFAELFDGLTQVPDIAGHDLGAMVRAVRDDKTQSWAVRVTIASLYLNMVHLSPTSGLIKNTGILSKGVHSGPHLQQSATFHNLNLCIDANIHRITWLEDIEPMDTFTRAFQEYIRDANLRSCKRSKRVSIAGRLVRRFGSIGQNRCSVYCTSSVEKVGGKDCRVSSTKKDPLGEPQAASSQSNIGRYQMQSRFIEFIKPCVHSKLRRIIGKFLRPVLTPNLTQPLYDVWTIEEAVARPTKRALFTFLPLPFRLSVDDPLYVRFSVYGMSRCIVRVLNELGYIVDVVDWQDARFTPNKKYDLFISHGGYNFERISEKLPSDLPRIHFSTGIYFPAWNQLEEERFRWLESRRGVCLPYDRPAYSNEERPHQLADGIITLGNSYTKRFFSDFSLVIPVNNAAYHDERFDRVKKDYASSRNNFLFFAGPGNVHKGLDLLLEAFVQTDAHLYICQVISEDFYEVYRNELENFPNIHLIGFIPMRRQRFYELVDTCNFVISASCAEGSQGGMVECMHQGLIPVITPENTIDIGDYGVSLNCDTIGAIVETIRELSQWSPEKCREMSQRTRKAAVTNFSEAAFARNMKAAIERVLAQKSSLGDVTAF